MEPDPSPDISSNSQSNQTKITNQDINRILGVSKIHKHKSQLYVFSKKVIIAISAIVTIGYLFFYVSCVKFL